MRKQVDRRELVIARISGNQHGIVTYEELSDAGMGPAAINRRLAAGRLHRIYRGVYAVGHRGLSAEGWWMAAVKACGDGAVLSHRSAAELWGMLKPAGGPVHVTVPGYGGRSRRRGIRVHRSATLNRRATTLRNRIPVTTPARTIADLRRTADGETVRKAIREAEFLKLPIAGAGAHADGTRSELERAFLRLCRRHGIAKPEVNVTIGPYTVDCLWREQRLVVELDGYGAHGGRQAFEDDRARDVELRLAGYEVVRFTYRQVIDGPAAVAASLRALLAARATAPRSPPQSTGRHRYP